MLGNLLGLVIGVILFVIGAGFGLSALSLIFSGDILMILLGLVLVAVAALLLITGGGMALTAIAFMVDGNRHRMFFGFSSTREYNLFIL